MAATRHKRKHGIFINPANRGLLHKTAGVPIGQKIPLSMLRRLSQSPDPATRKRAQFALNARKFHH